MKKENTILLVANLSLQGDKKLREIFNVITLSQLEKNYKDINGLVTTGGIKVDNKLIKKLPNLKVIATRGVGFDHIDLKAAQKNGIVVSNTPDVLTDCVADFAFGLLISLSRQIPLANTFIRDGKWINEKFFMTTKVSGKRLGIVGFGRIGQAIAKRANAFNMQIRYNSRSEKTSFEAKFEPSIIDLAKWADYLVLCAPSSKSTNNIINFEVLEALGSNGFLINIARGSLVDEDALIKAIKEDKIAGAALDVFKDEPYVPKELLESNKVLLSPHIASRTEETFFDMEELLIKNLEKYFTTGTLLTPVNEG